MASAVGLAGTRTVDARAPMAEDAMVAAALERPEVFGELYERYMPRVATRYKFFPDRMPFDFSEVVAALAPRPVLIVAPMRDDNFAVEGVREVVAAAQPVYEFLEHAERLQVLYPDCGHDFPDDARHEAYAFLKKSLAAGR